MSIRRALAWQIAVMLALITSMVMARAFAETPGLMLPFVFRMDFIFKLRGNGAQPRYGHARYTTLGEFARERVFNTIRRCNNGVRFDPLAPGCHLCSWYIVLPMSPGQTELEH